MKQSTLWTGFGGAISLSLGLWACSSGSSTGTGTGGSGTTGTTTTSTTTSTTTTSTTTSTTTTTTGAGGAAACPDCTLLATLPFGSAPEGITVDADNVYWTNAKSGEVMQMKKDGSGQVVLATEQGAPQCVVLSGGFVYWISYSGDGVMRRTPIGGGAIDNLVDAPGAREMVVAGGFAFWTRDPDDIQRIPADGLPPGGMPILLSLNPFANGITADADQVYWSNRQDGYVKKSGFELTTETVLGAGDVPWDIAVDDTTVYWTEKGSGESVGKVMKASKADGTDPTKLAADQNGPRGIALDKTHVYWANLEEGAIRRVPIGGGAVELVAGGQEKPANVAVDDTHVYWTNSGGHTVMKIAK